ncbi:LytR family transcriptional regulator [Nocardia colli]|uniref:LytR family transcriptional regulator n=1 Tax=Nocardia colli TaxID=2545717 RepID=A0A5N0ECQ0_9NOCA|nr:LCP family protein [Nocardia colli]KAA8887198.1 LytR family transcriptional regulator [Nocardia colli]
MADDDTVEFARVTDPDAPRARHRRAAPKARRVAAKPPRRAEKPHRLRSAAKIGVRVVVSVTALAVLSGTGFAWSAKIDFNNGFNRTDAIGADAPRSLGGDLNILLIGLDSRKDQNGNDLSKEILDQLHAGDSDDGGYNANSLILLHIPADMQKIVAFSIPRDDYVAVSGIPGYDHVKIKESYGLKKADAEAKLIAKGEKDQVTLERAGREAGRASIVSTVRNLTGVPIDRFAEVALAGFYHLAEALGGVDVCLNKAVDDSYYSGAKFPAGPQHLNGSDALAFVRQRHNLDNGDLDRTHRQQAYLTSVAKSLKDSGTLTNFGKLNDLMKVAHQDVVLSDNWDLLDFAKNLGAAGSISVEFRTLPVLRYDNINGQDVNIIDPAAIKKEVRAAFGVPAPSTTPAHPPTSTVDVQNAGSATGMAGKLSTALTNRGYREGEVGNLGSTLTTTKVTYGAGAEADATQLAETLGGLTPTASSNVTAGHIQVTLGSDFTMPTELTSSTSTPTTASTTQATPSTTTDPAPDAGKPVTTTIGSTIPCVN